MAVEAPNINLFPPQFITNVSDIICNTQINKADSGVTYNMNIPVTKINCFDSYNSVPRKNKSALDDDIVFNHIQQEEQQEIDRFIVQHVSVFLQRTRFFHWSTIYAIQESVTKKLKEKDEEIQRMVKINWVLQGRVKSMCLENQLWRDLAQTNEATADSLRINLEQVLAEERQPVAASADDEESSCGSSNEGWRDAVVGQSYAAVGDGGGRKCGEKEASVLLLPCRHLCLCTMCGSSMVGTCPACESVTNASVHVNMS